MRLFMSFVLVLWTSAAMADLPPNNLHLQDQIGRDANMTKEEFVAIIEHAEKLYVDVVKQHGGELVFEKKWEDSTVNAFARQSGTTWMVSMFGGLARRPEVTKDGFAMVVCHELGHHLAGFPFYKSMAWAGAEGQADYYASQSCARRLWKEDVETNAKFRNEVHPLAKEQCDMTWSTEADQNLCYRVAMAGYSLANLLGTLGGKTVDFAKPDLTVVKDTQDWHPQAQCRLDTYFSGGLCQVDFVDSIIPGRSHVDGQQSLGAERDAYAQSCSKFNGQEKGLRPLCWFAPKLSNW